MAEEDISGKPVAGSPEPVAIQDSNTTSEVPMPAEEQATAPIDSAQGEPEVAASEPITETPPAEAQPIDEAQGKTAQPQEQTAQRPAVEPFVQENFQSEESFNYAQDKTPPHSEESPRISREMLKELSLKGHSETQLRKRNKLDKILSLLGKKETVTNDEVEKLLRVSDATATRYLSLLKKEGKIRQVGKTGRGVMYGKISQ